VLRADYGTFTLGLLRGTDSAWDHVVAHFTRSCAELGPAVLLLAIVGALGGVRSGDGRPEPWIVRAVFGSWVFSGPVFQGLFNIPVGAFGDEISARFDLLPHLDVVILAGVGLDAILRVLGANKRLRLARAALVVGVGAIVSLQAVVRVPSAIPRRHTLAEWYGRDALALLPPHALLFIDGDRDFSVFSYLQEAARERRDVRVIHVALLGHRWYVGELRRHEPTLEVPYVPGRALSREIMVSAHRLGRRVFVTQSVAAQMSRTDRFVPFGVVVELLSPAVSSPRSYELEALQQAISDRVFARPTQTVLPRASDADIPALYSVGYRQLRAAYESFGDTASVRRCDEAASRVTSRFPMDD
jgi:hypothetical protein